MSELTARYNDGRTAQTRAVRPVISGAGLEIRDEDGSPVGTWRGDEIRLVDGRKGPGPVRLGRLDNAFARLTFDDRSALEPLLAAFPHLRHSHRPSRRTVLRVAAFSSGGIAALLVLVFVLIPVLAHQIAWALPDGVQARTGDRIADQLTQILAAREGRSAAAMACGNPAGVAALDRLVRRLGGDPGRYRVRVVDSGLVNAVAMPGGAILVPRGMIEFAGSPDALAGVLGHEMGHVFHRHPTENMLKIAGTSLLLSFIVGDISGGAVIVLAGEQVISGSYSRAAEREADAFAVRRMVTAGMDTGPFADLFERLLKKEKGGLPIPDFMASHPPTGERAAFIRRSRGGGTPALGARQWRALKAICEK